MSPIDPTGIIAKVEKPELIPEIRADLKLHKVADDTDGSPMYTLFDSVGSQYYKIGWQEAAIIKEMKPGLTVRELAQLLNKKSTAAVSEEDLRQFFLDAAQHNLLVKSRTGDELTKEVASKKTNPFQWLIFHYLYFRIPLFNPDRFLGKTLHYVAPLFSVKAFVLYAIIIVSALLQLVDRWDEFLHTFTYFFNLQGILVYGIAVTFVKVIHEFSHAYVAKKYDVHVPIIGVAFIVLWPVLYTDVTDSWKLSNRFKRLAISVAGVIAELVVAGLATWGWVLSSPGLWQSVFFLIASSTWITSLLVNLNPLMRFDGYYILSDLWGVENLQNRGFALTRWQLRKWFLGLNVPPPEEIEPSQRYGMIVYSLSTWVYRFSLYIFVALFVYFHFTKLLGIMLFLVEIGVFIIWPVIDELQQLIRLKSLLRFNLRSIFSLSAITLALAWFVLPLPHEEKFSAVTIPSRNQILYIPQDSIIEKIFVEKGQIVQAGDPIISMFSKPLEIEMKGLDAEIKELRRQLAVGRVSDEVKAEMPANYARLTSLKSRLKGLKSIEDSLLIKAGITGTVYYLFEPLDVGQHLKRDTEVAKIANLDSIQITGFVPEKQIDTVQVGSWIKVSFKNGRKDLWGKIKEISPYNNVNLDYEQLASINGGDLPVIKDPTKTKLLLVESYYSVVVELEPHTEKLRIGETGHLKYYGPWESKLVDLLKTAFSQFWKDSSL